jgi:hypothetical protein
MDFEKERLDALCAHVEELGIGELLPFLSVEEALHIEARQSLRKYLRRNRPTELLPYPEWFKELDNTEKVYVARVRHGYLNQIRAVPRGRGREARLKDIKQRYLKELRSIMKNLEKQAIRTEGFERVYASRYRGGVAPAASAIGGAMYGTNEHKWMALLEADFDMWVACL